MPETRTNTTVLEHILHLLLLVLVPVCLYVVFAVAPTEGSMGIVQRIFYVHLPAALSSFLGIGLCALFSALYLWTKRRQFDLVAHASGELGLLFCTIVLITGPIWARPVWGVWWTGEARLTSTLILWLIFAGYLILRQSAEEKEQAARWAAVVAIVGALDVPIIYKSVEWWRGLHPKVLRVSGGGGLDPIMERTLLLCTVTFFLLFVLLLIQRCRLGQLREEVESLEGIARRDPAVTRTTVPQGAGS